MTDNEELTEDEVSLLRRYRYHKHSGRYRPLARSQMEIIRTVIDIVGFGLIVALLLWR